MASPERIRKTTVLVSIAVMVACEPVMNTISHEKASTTTVRIAVAIFESVFFIPHLARIEVTPANRADKKANAIHIAYGHLQSQSITIASIIAP